MRQHGPLPVFPKIWSRQRPRAPDPQVWMTLLHIVTFSQDGYKGELHKNASNSGFEFLNCTDARGL
ncbi:hypothetical protein [Kitasatospora sp. NPDC098663]|uniref:hypothetical protein n=1 Tax=Kitasatospora sp. NPDC098663 TaxID=3364096 RepID=UPI0038025775